MDSLAWGGDEKAEIALPPVAGNSYTLTRSNWAYECASDNEMAPFAAEKW